MLKASEIKSGDILLVSGNPEVVDVETKDGLITVLTDDERVFTWKQDAMVGAKHPVPKQLAQPKTVSAAEQDLMRRADLTEIRLRNKAEEYGKLAIGKPYAVRVDDRTVVRGFITDCQIGRVQKRWTSGGNLAVEVVFAVCVGKPGQDAQGPFFVKKLPR